MPTARDGKAFRPRDLVPAALLLGLGLAALLLASIGTGAADGKFVVVTPPGWPLGRTVDLVRSADGRLLGAGGFHNIVFAASASPDFAARLRAAGAWLAEPAPLPPGCSSSAAGNTAT